MQRQLLIELLADPRRRFKLRAYCRRFGVTETQAREWMRDPTVDEEVKARVREILGGGVVLSALYRQALQQAFRGSFKHQRLLLEITGEYQPGLKITPDIETPEARFRRLEEARADALKSAEK